MGLIDMRILILLLCSVFTSEAAVFFWDRANTQLSAPNHPSLTVDCTNTITISLWCTKKAATLGGDGLIANGLVGGVGNFGLFGLKDSGSGLKRMDFSHDSHRGTGAASLWRSDVGHDTTNLWVHFVVTYTYTDTNSFRLYSNGVIMTGVWISFPTNAAGSAGFCLGINGDGGSIGGTAGRWTGSTSEICIWNKILNTTQIGMLRTSKIKGICRMIEPASLRVYYPLDSCPIGNTIIPVGPGSQNNVFPDRGVYKPVFASMPNQGVTRPIGAGESVHSYPPNE